MPGSTRPRRARTRTAGRSDRRRRRPAPRKGGVGPNPAIEVEPASAGRANIAPESHRTLAGRDLPKTMRRERRRAARSLSRAPDGSIATRPSGARAVRGRDGGDRERERAPALEDRDPASDIILSLPASARPPRARSPRRNGPPRSVASGAGGMTDRTRRPEPGEIIAELRRIGIPVSQLRTGADDADRGTRPFAFGARAWRVRAFVGGLDAARKALARSRHLTRRIGNVWRMP